MKKYSLLAVAMAAFGLMATSWTLTAADTAPSAPHQIGLIDMAHIFKNYEKFKDQTASLQKEAEDAQNRAKGMATKGQDLQAQLAAFTPGSAEYNKVEGELIDLQAKLQAFQQQEQREIVRKQAEVYKKIYLEVQDVVNRYASHYHYTLVIRFNRGDVAEASKPDAIIQNMNRQVVYYQTQDDITDPILSYLNDQYRKTAGR